MHNPLAPSGALPHDNFVNLLRARAARHPERSALQFLLDGDNVGLDMSYAELDRRARLLAAWLQRHAAFGERALLLYPSGPDYVVAFFACLYAGIIAVPAYPPELAHPQHLKRLLAMLHDCTPALVLTDSAALPGLRRLLPDSGAALMLATDTVPADCHEDQWQAPAIPPETLAFLQYTSGSTATPKGVMVSHRNLIANEVALAAGYDVREGRDKWVSWLPLYHDMGLICALLQPLYSGITMVLMSPRQFLERPLRWLKAISDHKATISGGPDFAYCLCLERITDAAAATLDLSSWRLAFNGAEPIRHAAFSQFADKFAPAGFARNALYPCYGLAEATVFVSGGVREAGMVATRFDAAALARGAVVPLAPLAPGADDDGAATLVACGMTWTGHQVDIIDPATLAPSAPGRVGEIWFEGPSVAEGYWRNEAATLACFDGRIGTADPAQAARRMMRTGDLGFWHDGQLYIGGRLKDVIILRGQNLYPQDIELAVEAAVPEVRKGRVAAFAVTIGGQEGIGLAAEVPRAVLRKLDAPALFRAIHRAIAAEHQEPASVILLLPPGELPKTSSGKLQRSSCRTGWQDGSLPVAAEFRRDRDWLLGAGYAAPADDAQARLADAWAEVLGVPRVGIHDNFFELGGHSLLAARLAARLRQAYGKDVPLRVLFEAPTVAQLAARLRQLPATAGGTPPLVPRAGSHAQPAPLSFSQQRLWFLHRMEPDSAAYNIAAAITLDGTLDAGALQAAFTHLVARHEALRTTFHDGEGAPLQTVTPPFVPALPLHDLSHLRQLPQAEAEAALHTLALSHARQPFDLEHGPLLRLALVRLDAARHVLLLAMHHIVSDGWSVSVLLREFAAGYAAAMAGHAPDLAPLPVQYADYASWQRQALDSAALAAQLDYWKQQLGTEPVLLELPGDRARPAAPSHRGARHTVVLPAALSASLQQLGREHGATLFMTLLAAYQALLHRLSGQRDIRVGVPVAGRNRLELEGLVGFFVNTQVLRAQPDPRQPFTALLRDVREAALGAQANQDVPFEQLVDALQPQRNLSHAPLCQVKFVLQQRWTHLADIDGLGGLQVTADAIDEGQARFDLALDVTEVDGELVCLFNYASDLFDAATIARWAGHWQTMLAALAAAPHTPVGDLPLLDQQQRAHLLQLAQGPQRAAPFVPVHAAIAAHAARRPHAPALVSENASLDYQALERASNRIAQYLAEQGVGPESRVALCLPRSTGLVTAMLGILKTGAAYVPLDPSWPAERLRYQLADCGARFAIGSVTADGVRALALDDPDLARYTDAPLPCRGDARHTAYVIYTSGSTGKPKGVAISHGALANYVAAVSERLPLEEIASMAMASTVGADLGHTVLFGALVHGCALHLVAEERAFDPDSFGEYMAAHAIDALKIVPSHLAGLLQAADPARVLPRRCLVLGGEAAGWPLVDTVERLAPLCAIVNHYGPTETTVGVLALPLAQGARPCGRHLPLGRPLANNAAYLLDDGLQPVPQGVPGELYIGGAQLARGYLNRPDLTAERFVPDPFGAPGARLYRTGDSARLLADGAYEYLGRRDGQVKLRGYRIETGEIAACLKQAPGVRDAAVLLRTDGGGSGGGEAAGARLVAYVAAAPGMALDALRAQLAAQLPDYMVPSALVRLDALPLTANGKLDHKALPPPDAASGAPEAPYAAPASATEATLAAIWQEVLKRDRIGVHDNFFALGGDSILSLQVIARARAQGLKIKPKQVFEQQTIAGLAQLLDAARCAAPASAAASAAATADAVEPPRPAQRPPRLPLSSAQQRLWFLYRMEPDSAAYNVPGLLRFTGALDATALRAAFTALVRRHETLRTTFRETDGVAEQVVHADAAPVLEFIDLSRLPGAQRDAEAQRLADADAARPFDLATGPLLRATLLKLEDGRHTLLLSLHHIVSDGWSINVLVRELAALYAAHGAGMAPPSLPPLPLQYADYALWQRASLETPTLQKELAYWTGRLGGEQPVLELPADRVRPAVARAQGGKVRFALDAGMTDGLRRLARSHDATLFMVLKAAFDVLLHRLSGQTDVRVGVPVANRNQVELENLIGFFVNTQVLRSRIDGATAFSSLLAAVKDDVLGAQAHQDVPFEQLVDALQPERDLSRSPLFQVLFNVQRPDYSGFDGVAGLALEVQARDNGTTQFDLSADIKEIGDRLDASLTYRTDLFEAATIERFAAYYTNLLRAALARPHARIGDLAMLPAAELHQLTATWNDTATAYPDALPVHLQFERQAARTPDAVALVADGQRLTYRELNAAANRLAHRLIGAGVTPDMLVGICAQRSAGMVAGLLAILKAGGAYVPLDPDYPAERLAYMLDDARTGVLLAPPALASTLGLDRGCRVLALSGPDDSASCWPEHNPGLPAHPGQLAYTIYTSGSTGQPKGAGVPHGGLANRLAWMQQAYRLQADDRVLQKTPFGFDVSVWEFFWPLITGATLVMAPPGAHRDPAHLAALIREHGVTTLHFVPSMLQAFAEHGALPQCVSLRRVLASGEALPAELVQRHYRQGNVPLHNLYGPTEASIDVTAWACSAGDDSVPIGRPIANTQVYVLDHAMNPVPAGAVGELYIGGVQLARGYHRRPGLTAERFVPDPFGPPGARLYRSGDLARWRGDGAVEYLGRTDHQVKLRGLRIELGEIEARLLAHPQVREAAVLARGDGPGGLRLVGYVVAGADGGAAGGIAGGASLAAAPTGAAPATVTADALRTHLLATLPDYMAPSAWVFLDAMPLSPNGKLDRKALPEPDAGAAAGEYAPPRTGAEAQLARIWAEVLNLRQAGVHDNFFTLGGDSIVALQVVSRARDAGLAITPRDLFQHQTIELLAQAARPLAAQAVQADQGTATGAVPLTPIQSWFFSQEQPQPHHWNQAVLLQPTRPLDPAALDTALRALVRHHDALRLRFTRAGDGHWQQHYGDDHDGTLLQTVDLSGVAREETAGAIGHAATRIQSGLDLARGPLLAAAHLRLRDGGERLLLAVHHLAVDGVSWRILAEDLETGYRQAASGEPVKLPSKTSSYQAWAERLRTYAGSDALHGELAYWRGHVQPMALPAANPAGANLAGQARRIETRLDAGRTRQLLQQAPAAYHTQINDLLLTALAQALCGWSGAPSALVELEGHGREDIFDGIDLSRSVGWFTSRFPVSLAPHGDAGSAIKAVKEHLRTLPNRGMGWGVLEFLGDARQRDALRALPQPQVSFNYLGQLDSAFGGLFRLAPEAPGASSSPDARRGHWLSVNGHVADDMLTMAWTYSPAVHGHAEIEALAHAYMAALETLIAHCLETEGGFTPSDFPDIDIGQGDLDRFLDDIL
jgi:amino acid adenylation domain-containing protein/non-ribosomal peptide synthase protein (TIGR01720 family)